MKTGERLIELFLEIGNLSLLRLDEEELNQLSAFIPGTSTHFGDRRNCVLNTITKVQMYQKQDAVFLFNPVKVWERWRQVAISSWTRELTKIALLL